VLGEANFSDHGANRLGASALMQGLADGYFVIPYTIGNYLAQAKRDAIDESHAEVRRTRQEVDERLRHLLAIGGKRSPDSFHRELGHLVWEHCGMARDESGLSRAIGAIRELRDEFSRDLTVPGSGVELNQSLEKAGRIADFFELAELMCHDALERRESCGGHFREEFKTPEGEARRDDAGYSHVAAWEFTGAGEGPKLHKEPLVFEFVKPSQRSYK